MLGSLVAEGYEVTTDRSEAQLIVVNTCGFLQSSVKESIDRILDLARQKEEGSCQKLVVAGCLAQRYRREIPKELPEVDLFVGTNERLPTAAMPRLLATAPHTAYVKIAEGCNHTCSFCIIPQLRGKQRSRPIDDIVREVQNLIAGGVRELNLIAQDTTDYGCDRHDGTTIEALFRELAKIPGDHWYRLMYAYPLRFSDELISMMADSPNFCRYVDVPFQHINDRILRSMRRGSDGGYIRRLVERLRGKIPDIAIRSTWIVGYPGETEEEFSELLDFLQEARLERVGVFAFSRESGTDAAELPGQIPEAIKKERRRLLMESQQKISLQKNRSRIGQRIRVLAETSRGKEAKGRSEWDAPEIDGQVFLKGAATPGKFCEALVQEAAPYDLTAIVC